MDLQEPQPGPEERALDQPRPSADLMEAPNPARTARRRIRSGPIAAIVATAVVLGVTALPAAAPRPARMNPPARVLTTSSVEQVSQALAVIQLGSPFGSLEPMPGAVLEALDDGTERFTFQLREADAGPDAPAAFEGYVQFLRPIDADTPDADGLRFFKPRMNRLVGEPALAPVESRADLLAGSTAFRAASGQLTGLGDHAGVRLTLRAAPGSGVWCPDDRRFAHLLWFREASSHGQAVPDMGMGEVAFRRARLR